MADSSMFGFTETVADDQTAGGGAANTPTTPAPVPAPAAAGAPGAPAADQPDPLDAELDTWQAGTGSDDDDDANADPLAGIDPNHPLVQRLMAERDQYQQREQQQQIATELVRAGIPTQAVPELLQLFSAVRQVVSERDQYRQLLEQIDTSPVVKRANADKIAKRFGRYGVTADELMIANPRSNREMLNLARTLAVVRRKQGVSGRAKNQQDTFEGRSVGSGGTGFDIMDPKVEGLDVLRSALRRR